MALLEPYEVGLEIEHQLTMSIESSLDCEPNYLSLDQEPALEVVLASMSQNPETLE